MWKGRGLLFWRPRSVTGGGTGHDARHTAPNPIHFLWVRAFARLGEAICNTYLAAAEAQGGDCASAAEAQARHRWLALSWLNATVSVGAPSPRPPPLQWFCPTPGSGHAQSRPVGIVSRLEPLRFAAHAGQVVWRWGFFSPVCATGSAADDYPDDGDHRFTCQLCDPGGRGVGWVFKSWWVGWGQLHPPGGGLRHMGHSDLLKARPENYSGVLAILGGF